MQQLEQIARAFWEIWSNKTPPSDPVIDVKSLSLDDAYLVQQQLLNYRVARGERVVGYKVGCTSKVIRRQLGLSEPISGRLLAPHVHADESVLHWADYSLCAVEPEFVLRIGEDVPGEVSDDRQLRDAIEWVAAGIEIHNFNFWCGDPTSQELIASNGLHAALVVGERRISPAALDFDMEGVGLFRDEALAASGIGAEILGGPLKSLRWLVNHLDQRGEHLKAGQLVIPGSPVELVSVEPNDRIIARFTTVGSVSATFAG